MDFLRRHKNTAALLLLIILFLFSRLYRILNLPIFTDESIYIYWAKYIELTQAHWFISLSDGKPPLLIWMILAFLKILPSDMYLLAGRLPSVIAGLIGLIGMYKLTGLILRSSKIALISGFLYTISPFILFYDRMALFDSLLSAMLIWSVYFAFKTFETKKIKYSFLWGIFLGFAFLSKPTAVIFLILTPLCALLFYSLEDIKKSWKELFKFSFLAIIISEIINNFQRISKAYVLAGIKNQQFQQPLDKLLSDPFKLTLNSTNSIVNWIIDYYTIPLYIVGLFSFIFLGRKNIRLALILFIFWFFPIFIFATVGRELFPRYVLFITPYFLIPLAYVFSLVFEQKGLKRMAFIILIFFTILMPLNFDYSIITKPETAPITIIDYRQYITDHPSGYGLDSVFSFIDQEAAKEKIVIVTQGTFGLYPYAFMLHYWDNKNIEILTRWPINKIDDDLWQVNKRSKLFIILKEQNGFSKDLPLNVVLKAEKPGGRYPISVTTLK